MTRAGPVTRSVDAGDARFHLRDWGRGNAPALLFWHGLGATGAALDAAARVLVREYGLRVLAPDAPGFGDSPAVATPDGYRSDESAAQAVALLDALGIQRAAFLGHSWGATVGCYVAAAHPDRTSALALLDGGYLDLADLMAGGPPPPYELLVDEARRRRPAQTTPEVWSAVVDAGFRQPPSAVLARLPRELPVLVVAAGEPADMRAVREERLARFRAAVPQAAVETLPGVSHDLLAEAGGTAAVVVGDWLRRAQPGGL